MKAVSSTNANSQELKFYACLFVVFVLVSILSGCMFELSGILERAELQTIDRRFEARRFLSWSPEGLKRLNPGRLWAYHQEHEIPRRWWAWDYTFSWLIEPNHIPVVHKIVIFNHLLEDEPPAEALQDHPWAAPLMQHPVPRRTVAEVIKFLASSGARLIILDNDFPQYSADDMVLAGAIHASASGELGARPVPVLMASTVNHRSFANILQLDMNTGPAGILKCLAELEPGVDVQGKYTGTTSMILDEDQVVRRSACRVPDADSRARSSITLKALVALGESLPKDLPREMDIDFAGPPNSELYPVRPFSYLLDPELQKRITNAPPGVHDVTLKDAIVIIGDGVTDLYATPYTNLGVNLMSGSEILAQTIDTVSRRSWHYRLDLPQRLLYLSLCAISGGGLLFIFKRYYTVLLKLNQSSLLRPALDMLCSILIVLVSCFAAGLLFCHARLIVPVVVPTSAIMVASLATALWEQESLRSAWLQQKLAAAEENLKLQAEKHDEELKRQRAEAYIQEITQDQQRRREFVRKINHDLKAPVTVMSWILARLIKGGLSHELVTEKISRLAKTSNRLVDLLHELAASYESPGISEDLLSERKACQLNQILQDCASMAASLAEMKSDRLVLNLPERLLWVNANPLMLARVFDNLIRNAILHNPVGTDIVIEARSRAHVHQITISDNGCGIEPEKLEGLLVNKEQQSGAEAAKRGSINGMGLQIALAFVDSMGGKLGAESTVGCGTTFLVTLPSSHLEAGGQSGEDIFYTGSSQQGDAEVNPDGEPEELSGQSGAEDRREDQAGEAQRQSQGRNQSQNQSQKHSDKSNTPVA